MTEPGKPRDPIAEASELLRRVEPPRADEVLRARQIQRAMNEAQAVHTPRRPRYGLWGLAAACAAVIIAVGLLWVLDRGAPAVQRGVYLLAGALQGQTSYAVGDRVGSEPVVARAAAELRLDDGSKVELEPATQAQLAERQGWQVSLTTGRVRVKALRQRHGRRLRVRTPEAVTRVVGTRFEVTRDVATGTTVRVSEGRVEVEPAAEPRLYPVNGPAGVIRIGLDGRVITSVAADAGAADRREDASVSGDAARDGATADVESQPEPTMPHVAQIRRQIRGGRLARARTLIRRGRRAGQGRRRYLAELAIVESEAFLAEKRFARAIRSYLAVARRFRGTPQSEAALFAAGQLSFDHQRGRASALLRRYLGRYPRGRFSGDATRLLEVLDKPK